MKLSFITDPFIDPKHEACVFIENAPDGKTEQVLARVAALVESKLNKRKMKASKLHDERVVDMLKSDHERAKTYLAVALKKASPLRSWDSVEQS